MELVLPQEPGDKPAQKIIVKSQTDFFTSQFCFHQEKCREKMNKGVLLLITGITAIMQPGSWVRNQSGESFPIIGLKVLPEQAGWF